MKSSHKYSLAIATAFFLPVMALAQVVSYTAVNSVYSQDFNGLPTTGSVLTTTTVPVTIQGKLGATGVNGWYMLNDRGSAASTTEFRAQDGSLSGSGGRGVVSFGTTGSTERALGVLATSNQISTFGVFLRNDTAATLTQFSLSYTGEQWRAGDPGLNNQLGFSYKVVNSLAAATLDGEDVSFTSVSALSFDSPFIPAATNNTALNGNLPLYQQNLSALQTFSWAPGQYLVLQWAGEDLSGQDNGLAIDNLSFAAIPEPGTYAAILGAITLAVTLWRRRFSNAVQQLVA